MILTEFYVISVTNAAMSLACHWPANRSIVLGYFCTRCVLVSSSYSSYWPTTGAVQARISAFLSFPWGCTRHSIHAPSHQSRSHHTSVLNTTLNANLWDGFKPHISHAELAYWPYRSPLAAILSWAYQHIAIFSLTLTFNLFLLSTETIS